MPKHHSAEIRMNKSNRPLVTARLLAAMAAITTLPLAAPAMASGITGRDITVRYADLDVDTIDGATVLLRRIEGAAARVCAPLDHGDLASGTRRESCEQKLTAAAVVRVNSPALASLYRSVYREAPRVIAQAQ
jgi:UrcA family protein